MRNQPRQPAPPRYEGGDTSMIYRPEPNGTDAFDLQLGDAFTAGQNWNGRLVDAGAGAWNLTDTYGRGMEPLAVTTHNTIREALAFFAGLANAANGYPYTPEN